MGRFRLGIVIPAKNESGTILKVVNSIKKYGDILVISDASTDLTDKILKEKKINYLRNSKTLGYEKTILKGIKYLLKKKYSHLATFDADGEHDYRFFNNIKKFYKYDLIIGKRKSFNRYSEYIFSFLTNLIFKVQDPLSGLRVYKCKFLKKINLNNDNIMNTSIIFKIKFLKGKIIYKKLNVYKRKDKSRMGSLFFINLKIFYYIFKLLFKLLFIKLKT